MKTLHIYQLRAQLKSGERGCGTADNIKLWSCLYMIHAIIGSVESFVSMFILHYGKLSLLN